MPSQHYSMSPYPVETILSWVKSGDIAIPEIQRPFVWNPVQVRALIDSLYQGFPVGYLIAWRNPNIRLRDGSRAAGKRLLIDGQQRITALMSAVLGMEVVTKEYDRVTIRIAFNPLTGSFEVPTPPLLRDPAWMPDISAAFTPTFSVIEFATDYYARNPGSSRDAIYRNMEKLRDIVNNSIGMIELDPALSIETVAEIFFRVNREGTPLSQADFVMSKIACNEEQDGVNMRKAIDYFCHMGVAPGFQERLKDLDRNFAATDFYKHISWLRNDTDDIYAPTYLDVLRVAFTASFGRGALEDLVSLLSGYNFDTRQHEDVIVEQSFRTLRKGLLDTMTESHFKKFVTIVRSAGFVDAAQVSSRNTLNFAYVIYLDLRTQRRPQEEIAQLVRRWLVLSILTGRYTGSPDATFDQDIRQIRDQGFDVYAQAVEDVELSRAYWDSLLPQMLLSSSSAQIFRVFQAAQIHAGDKAFLSGSIPVSELVHDHADAHHIFPQGVLRRAGVARARMTVAPNLVMAPESVSAAIGDRSPDAYFAELARTATGGHMPFGDLESPDALRENFRQHCIPEHMATSSTVDYEAFLDERRKLMAARLRAYYESL